MKRKISVFILLLILLALVLGVFLVSIRRGENIGGRRETGRSESVSASSKDGERGRDPSPTPDPQPPEPPSPTPGPSPAPALSASPMIRGYIAIDPGHQGPEVDMSDPEPNAPGSSQMKAKATAGTSGRYSGIGEYQLNLDLSRKLAGELEARGYKTLLTRTDHQTAISNSERALMANEAGCDLVIHIHANGSEDPAANGACALIPGEDNPYCGQLSDQSRFLSETILDHYCRATGLANAGITLHNDMTGINWSRIPVMILELGFMTNQSDDLYMADQSNQELMAASIADGVEEYYRSYPTAYRPEDFGGRSDLLDGTAAAVQSEYIDGRIGEDWSVSLIDLSEGSMAGIRGDVRMPAASLVKLFIMAAAYDYEAASSAGAESGEADLAGYGDMRDLVSRMITTSDNEAGNTLIEALGGGDVGSGMERVNDYCQRMGYRATHLGRLFLADNQTDDNYTSSEDCARLLARIYSGTCVGRPASEEMAAFLKAQTRTNKLPEGLEGRDAVTANKTGELNDPALGRVENDAAIVWSPRRDYVICVLSSKLTGNEEAIQTIRELSGSVYDRLQA